MPYIVRHTFSPEHDLCRNWSAWIGGAWDSREAALRDLAEESPAFDRLQERFSSLDESEIINRVIEQEAFDVRYNEAYGKWQHVHHEGLSGYLLNAETVEDAWAEARHGEFPWFGFGEATRGDVVLLGQLRDTLHLFWCEDTIPES